MPVSYTGNLWSLGLHAILALYWLFAFILYCEDSGIVSASNPMHTWFFYFGSAYLSGFFGVWVPKFFCQASTFLNLEITRNFAQKTGITGVSLIFRIVRSHSLFSWFTCLIPTGLSCLPWSRVSDSSRVEDSGKFDTLLNRKEKMFTKQPVTEKINMLHLLRFRVVKTPDSFPHPIWYTLDSFAKQASSWT